MTFRTVILGDWRTLLTTARYVPFRGFGGDHEYQPFAAVRTVLTRVRPFFV